MLETFQVLHIEEPDFGCEGWPDGFEIKDKVLLKSNLTGEEKIIHEKMPDCMSWTSTRATKCF